MTRCNIRVERWSVSSTACCRCGAIPAKFFIYDPDPELVGAFCPDCYDAYFMELLRSKRITRQQLSEAAGRMIDSMSEEQLMRTYIAFVEAGLEKDDKV